MVNEKTIEAEKTSKVEAVADINSGDKPKRLDKIERAELVAKRLEEAEKRIDEKIDKLSELQANQLLGSTAGGHIEPVPAKMETAKEYAERVMNNRPVIKDADGRE